MLNKIIKNINVVCDEDFSNLTVANVWRELLFLVPEWIAIRFIEYSRIWF